MTTEEPTTTDTVATPQPSTQSKSFLASDWKTVPGWKLAFQWVEEKEVSNMKEKEILFSCPLWFRALESSLGRTCWLHCKSVKIHFAQAALTHEQNVDCHTTTLPEPVSLSLVNPKAWWKKFFYLVLLSPHSQTKMSQKVSFQPPRLLPSHPLLGENHRLTGVRGPSFTSCSLRWPQREPQVEDRTRIHTEKGSERGGDSKGKSGIKGKKIRLNANLTQASLEPCLLHFFYKRSNSIQRSTK